MKKDFFDKGLKTELIEIFESVKDVVKSTEGRSRSGLMLGLQELGSTLNGFIGAYYPISSNIIVMNKTPIRRIIETNSKLFNPYSFHVLLHEYIHSLGFLDESLTRKKTYDISKKKFGENHIITKLSVEMEKYFPNLVYPIQGWIPNNNPLIEIVTGFDKSSFVDYIT